MLKFDDHEIHQGHYAGTCNVMGVRALYYSVANQRGIAVTGLLRAYKVGAYNVDFIGQAHPLEIPGLLLDEYVNGRVLVRLSSNGLDYITFTNKNRVWCAI